MATDNVELIQLAKKVGRQEAINHILKIHNSKSIRLEARQSIEELRLFDWLITELTEWADRQEKLDRKLDGLFGEIKKDNLTREDSLLMFQADSFASQKSCRIEE